MKKIQIEAMLEVQDFGICTVVQGQVKTCGTLLTENSTGLEKASRIICTLTTKRQGQQTKKQINEMDFAASSWRA